MMRFAAMLVLVLGVAACGQQGPTLEGRWGVGDVNDCAGDQDVFSFQGREFFHLRGGNAAISGTDLAYSTSDADTGERVSAVYSFNGQTHQLTFDRDGDDVLVFRGATVNGEVSQSAQSALGLRLYRCPAES